jgi:hypothetical protein
MSREIKIHVVIILLSMLVIAHAYAAIKNFSIMALSPIDNRVVIKANSKMHVLKGGDKIPGTSVTIKQILVDKIVVEEIVDAKTGKKEKLWIYKPVKPGGKSKIKRMQTTAPPQQKHKKPVIVGGEKK